MSKTLRFHDISKLSFFLELALQGQQFPLIIFDEGKEKEQDRELQESLKDKKTELLKVITLSGNISFETILKEAKNPGPDLFEENSPGTYALRKIALNEDNIEKVLDTIAKVRLNGTFEYEGNQIQFPDYMKFLFTVENGTLKNLPDQMHDKILYSFSPVYRFKT